EEFAALVGKMMVKDPDVRLATAAAVRQQLLPWAAGVPDLPLDQPGDATFLYAVTSLEAAEITADMARDTLLAASALPQAIPVGDAPQESLWVIASLAGFWLLLLLVLGLVLLTR